MCGIIGYIGSKPVVPVLIDGLRRMEYRGYDSAGVAVINGTLKRLRSTGRVAALAALAREHGLAGSIGIAESLPSAHSPDSTHSAQVAKLLIVHSS